MAHSEKPFFVGYLGLPKALVPLMLTVTLSTFAVFCLLALTVGATQDDPGDGRVRFDFGRQTVSGVLEMTPYPMLHVVQGSEQISEGETLLLAGAGKFGTADRLEALQSEAVQVTGVILNRGSIQMLQVGNQNRNIQSADLSPTRPEPVDLGKWRLAGEICDGKCVAGAMRPGRGLAHKACADLCILGGVPPVFVVEQPVEGFEFMLIGAADGGPLDDALLAKVGVYVSLEGRLEKRGGMAVFLADTSSLEVIR